MGLSPCFWCTCVHQRQRFRCHVSPRPRIVLGSRISSGYTESQDGVHRPTPTSSEVRLPQGLRFTDDRRSAIRDIAVARSGSCASKSHGRLGCALLPASCVLCGSPLPQLSSAPICDVCWTEFPALSGAVCARCGDALQTCSRILSAVQGLPPGAAAVCAGSGLRALRGADEGGHPRAQI